MNSPRLLWDPIAAGDKIHQGADRLAGFQESKLLLLKSLIPRRAGTLKARQNSV